MCYMYAFFVLILFPFPSPSLRLYSLFVWIKTHSNTTGKCHLQSIAGIDKPFANIIILRNIRRNSNNVFQNYLTLHDYSEDGQVGWRCDWPRPLCDCDGDPVCVLAL